MHSVVVIKKGYIVEEDYSNPSYDQNRRHVIQSCTKSIISALIGIAIHVGYISNVDQKILDYFPDREIDNLNAQKQAWTIEHFLTMTSGLEWDEWPAKQSLFRSWYTSGDWVQFILDRPVVNEPGTVFNYNSGAVHILSAIIQQATGSTTLEFAQKYLFDPLGITNLYWSRDPEGIYTGGGGLELTPRDMAIIGYLYLNNGIWGDEQIIPAHWVEYSTKTQISASSHISGLDYSYLWWVYPSLVAYAALGWAGQQIFVIPDHELVVVFTGDILTFPSYYITLIRDFIFPAENVKVSEMDNPGLFLITFIIPGILTIIVRRRKAH